MPTINKQTIKKGRDAVDAYRQAHTALHSKPWDRGVPAKHTPHLNALLLALQAKGFTSLDQFFDASDELNVQELGFKDRRDSETRCKDADRQALERMWH